MQPQSDLVSCRTRTRDTYTHGHTHTRNKVRDAGCDTLIFSLLFYLGQPLVTTPQTGFVSLEHFTMVHLTNVEVEGLTERRWGELPGVARGGGAEGRVWLPMGEGTLLVIPMAGKEMRLEEARLNM